MGQGNKKHFNRANGTLFVGNDREYYLAQIGPLTYYFATLKQKKREKGNKYNLPRYKIRIKGEHDHIKDAEASQLPFAYNRISAGSPATSSGDATLLKNQWVYVYKEDNQWFIDRVLPNTKCDVATENSGFEPGSNIMLVPDTMWKKGRIEECAEVFNTQVEAEIDEKYVRKKIIVDTWCDSAKGKAASEHVIYEIKWSKQLDQKIQELTKPLRDIQDAIDNAKKGISGDPNDERDFWTALRQNDVSLQNFNNTVAIYQANLKSTAELIANFVKSIMLRVQRKFMEKVNATANLFKGTVPASGRYVANSAWSEAMKKIACAFQLVMEVLPDLILGSLEAFLKKIVNTGKCIAENFIGGFIGQILGQISTLVNGILNGIIAAFTRVSDLVGGVVDLVSSIGDTLSALLSLLECEFDYCRTDDGGYEWSISGGPTYDKNKLNLDDIFKKAKEVGRRFDDVQNIPKDILDYEFKIDFPDLTETIFDGECDGGFDLCGVPQVTFFGGGEIVKATGNAVVSAAGDIIGIDVTDGGEYTGVPLVQIDDGCGNGNNGTGTVIIGPVTGIGTVGVATTGGLGGDLGDLDDDGTTGGQFGQGTTAGTGITFHVTVNRRPTGNKYFIDGKQQQTLLFERGNTYILNQEHVSNLTHQLRFSETKGGTHGGGVEYTRGVTIDGVPGLGKSTTDTAYSRIVVDSNTPPRLYYYCINHPGMGGVINVITPEIVRSTVGRDATVKVETVNPNGGVISLTNLIGGTGYNECMANIPTDGGNGTGLTLEVVRTNGGSVAALSINNKGSNYQVGDVVTLTARLSKPIARVNRIGVTKVFMNDAGFGYLSAPDGSKGGDGRTWANRCQTIVRRKNLDWDVPYDEGDIINLSKGDWVQLPGKPKVFIDDSFDETKLPGAQVTGVSTYIARDMTNFPISDKTGKKSKTFNFQRATLIDTFAPNGKWQWPPDYPMDEAYGVQRIDSTSPDVTAKIAQWKFYAAGEFLGELNQDNFGQDIQVVNDDILYRIGNEKKRSEVSDPFDDQIPWVRTADILPLNSWVLTSYDGWSQFLKTYGVYPSVNDPQYSVIGTMTATWRVATFTPGIYTFEMQADNIGTIYMDGVKLGSTLPYAGHNRELKFKFATDSLEPQIHEIKVDIENKIHRDGLYGQDTYNFNINPAAVAWVLKDPNGSIVKTSLDAYGVEDFADILYGYDTYFSIKAYNVTDEDITVEDEWFDCEVDYKRARLLGFTDCDIRAFLEKNPDIKLDPCMQSKIDDENWGNCDGNLNVSLTAPGCPKDPCIKTDTYPVLVCLDEIIVENPGFGFDPCKDTVNIKPSNGAKAKIEESVNGEIRRIVVTDCGAGFTELPEISINTETGYNAILKPIMKFHKPEEIDVPKGTNVIQVIDCVGKVS